jgi:hypothetical protein
MTTTATHPAIKPGDFIRTLSLSGLWQVIDAGSKRVKCKPIDQISLLPRSVRWFELAEVIRAEV